MSSGISRAARRAATGQSLRTRRSGRGLCGLRTFVAVALLGAATTSGAALPAGAQNAPTTTREAQEAQTLVILSNRLRATVGAHNLTVRDDLTSLACEWAETMMQSGDVSHSPYISDSTALSDHVGRDWTLAGENVGTGPDVYLIQGALVGSPAHYRNLVDADFTHVGVCVRHDAGGALFVAQEFLSVKPAKTKRTKR